MSGASNPEMRLAASRLFSFPGWIPRPQPLPRGTVAWIIAIAAIGLCVRALAEPREVDAQSCTVRIHTDGLRDAKGVVGILLFRSTDGWPENVSKSYRQQSSSIAQGARQVTVTLENVPAGNYAVVALHDENKNMKLDRNLVGWPKEGFGFANNPHVGLSPPAFKRAVLHVACPETDTTIHMVYK
jgi:uncharacterized protein (DUF2141 family)